MAVRKTVKDVAYYLSSNYGSQLLAIPKGIIIANILGPALYGTFAIFITIQQYLTKAQLGIIEGIYKDVPYYLGKGDTEKVKKIESTSFFTILLISSLAILGIFLVRLVSKDAIENNILYLSLLFAVTLANFQKLFNAFLRVRQKILTMSIGNFLLAGSDFTFAIVLTYYFSLAGRFSGYLISLFAIVVFFYLSLRSSLRIQFNNVEFSTLKGIIKVGFPLFILGFVTSNFYNIDKLIVASFFTKEQMGFYSITLFATNFFNNIPMAISYIYFPKIREKMGAGASATEIFKTYIIPTRMLSISIPYLLGIAFLLIPGLIRAFLPKFTPSIIPLQTLIFGVFFLSLVSLATSILISYNKQRIVTILTLIAVGINVALNMSFFLLGYGINMVAIGTLTSYVVWSFMILLTTKILFKNLGEELNIVRLLLPLFVNCILLALINYLGMSYLPVKGILKSITILGFFLVFSGIYTFVKFNPLIKHLH